MKKNLKKVISAVIAMALAASMIPATFAAKVELSDVAETASYATAVNTLVALDVINGYEDGTFLPDKNITRAEVSKVMVAALNKLSQAEGRKGATGFTDVAADHWATGFINVGVSEKLINGMGDGTFAPEANVTIAQVVKMLGAALGYNAYAAYLGEGQPNWYDGWMAAGSSAGFTKNLNAAPTDDATRAQVAQLVYDALLTPIVLENGIEFVDGKYVPKIEVQDGSQSKYFKTLLTEDFDAYYVEGYVTAKGKNEDKTTIDFAIANSEAYESADFSVTDKMPLSNKADASDTSKGGKTVQSIDVADTNADEYVGVYAAAIIRDVDGDYELISFVPSGKNKSITFEADDIDKDSTAAWIAKNGKIEVSGTTYKLATSIDLYVNGVHESITFADFTTANESTNTTVATKLLNYIHDYNVGTVEMVDTYKTDGKYDAFYVNMYATAKVTSVSASSEVINFTAGTIDGTQGVITGKIDLDVEDREGLEYTITKNGEAISLSDIKKDDIISIAYEVEFDDVSASDISNSIEDSEWYDIKVSTEKATGKLTSRSTKNTTLTVGGTAYGFVDANADVTTYTVGNEYSLILDAFGRIFDYDIDATNDLWGLVTKLTYSTAEEEYRVEIYTADGTKKAYYMDADKATVNGVKKSSSVTSDDVETELLKAVYSTYTVNQSPASTNLLAAENRVITYKVSSVTGKITTVTSQTGTAGNNEGYKPKTSTLAGAKINENTVLVNAEGYTTDASDLTIASVSNLSETGNYGIFKYGDRNNNNGAFPYVLIKTGDGAYGESSRFALVTGAGDIDADEKYDTVTLVNTLYNGEARDLRVLTDEVTVTGAADLDALKAGDVIFFEEDANGYVDAIDVVFSIATDADYATDIFANIATATGLNNTINMPTSFNADWADDAKPQLVFGPVAATGKSTIDIAQVKAGETLLGNDATVSGTDDGIYTVSISDDTQVYKVTYDDNTDVDDRASISNAAEIVANVALAEDTTNDKLVWSNYTTSTCEDINYVFAMVVDGDVVCAVYYTAQ